MVDPELEAITKCTELLKELDDEAKIRILHYLIHRYKLNPNKDQGFGTVTATQTETVERLPPSIQTNPRSTFAKTNPALMDVVRKSLPKSEPEWLLVYCYYASDFGANEFTKESIISQYDQSKRMTIQRKRNLSANIIAASKKDWIQSINSSEFIITDVGKSYVDEILSGKSTTQQRKPGKKNKKSEGEEP